MKSARQASATVRGHSMVKKFKDSIFLLLTSPLAISKLALSNIQTEPGKTRSSDQPVSGLPRAQKPHCGASCHDATGGMAHDRLLISAALAPRRIDALSDSTGSGEWLGRVPGAFIPATATRRLIPQSVGLAPHSASLPAAPGLSSPFWPQRNHR